MGKLDVISKCVRGLVTLSHDFYSLSPHACHLDSPKEPRGEQNSAKHRRTKRRAIAWTTTTTTTATRAYDGERDRRKDRAQKDRWVPALPERALREFQGVPPIPKSVLLFFFFLSQPTTPVCVDGREDAEPRGLVRARSQGLHDHRAASLGPRPHSLSPFSRATTKTRTLTEKSSFLFLFSS